MYDFLIVGAGLYGSVFAQQCQEHGKSCLVIDKRDHIGGNVYSEKINGIDVHRYGPHIFNTNSERIWTYANRFSKFIQYAHRVKVNYHDKLYSMPINLQTMYEVYGISTPAEAQKKLAEVSLPIADPQNFEECCLSQLGPQLYEIFIKHYTKKQWGKDPKDLPAAIFKRLPIRFNFDDRWHESVYSGIPTDGYTAWIAKMLEGVRVELTQDFFTMDWRKYARQLVYTGKIDELFGYCYGELEYRSLRFETQTLDGDFQGIAQVNYTDETKPYTRITEHKHFTRLPNDKTVITWEYPLAWSREATPFYPINDVANDGIYHKYKKELARQPLIIGGGRLCEYRYLNMDQVIASALKAYWAGTKISLQ